MVSAIVPAAGSSRRMGRPKLLLPFRGTTILGALLDLLRAGGVERVVVVVAADDAALRALVARRTDVELIENPRPERGMLSSVLCGLAALGGAAAVAAGGEPLLVTPADLPSIEPATVARLIALARAGDAPLALPTCRGERGHPLAIAPAVVAEMASLDPEIGLRQLLDRHAVAELAVDDEGVLADADTPEDYARLNESRG